MKARVKATGEIVEVHTHDDADFQDRQGRFYWEHQLYFGSLDVSSHDEPDYWEKLKHQAAISAMQGILSNESIMQELDREGFVNEGIILSDMAMYYATSLINKLKGE